MIGREAESQFNETMAQLSKATAADYEIRRYNRGVFSATAQTMFTLPWHPEFIPNGPPIRLILNHVIKHGPLLRYYFPGGKSAIEPGLAAVETHVEFTRATQRALQPFLGSLVNKLTADNLMIVSFDGDAENTMSIPAFEINDRRPQGVIHQLKWGGWKAKLFFSEKFQHITGSHSLSELNFTSSENHFELRHMAGHVDLRRHPSTMVSGEMNLSISRVSADLFNVENHFEVSGLRWRQSIEVPDNAISAITSLEFEKASLVGDVYGPGGVAGALRGLDAGAVMKLRRLAGEFDHTGQWSIRSLGVLFELLKNAPELEVSTVSLEADQGDLSGRAKLSIKRSPFALLNPISSVTARVEIQTAEDLALKLLSTGYKMKMLHRKEGGKTDELEKRAVKQAQSDIDALLTRNILIRQGGGYKLLAQFQNGELTINDRPVSLSEIRQLPW